MTFHKTKATAYILSISLVAPASFVHATQNTTQEALTVAAKTYEKTGSENTKSALLELHHHGNPFATMMLTRSYAKGVSGFQKNQQKAKAYRSQYDERQILNLLKNFANRGNTDALNWLGNHYRDKGTFWDNQKATQYFNKSAEKGSAYAMVIKAFDHSNKKNYTQAMQLFKKAGNLGNAVAMLNVGLMYAQGKGVAQNHDQAFQWYQKASDKGHKAAMYNIGMMYKNGLGTAKDAKTAVEWFKKSADKGEPWAMAHLGIMYAKGVGVQRDMSAAFQWNKKASEKNNVVALNNLGWQYHRGLGVTKNFNTASKWYLKAYALADVSNENGKKTQSLARKNLENLFASGKITDTSIRKQVSSIFAKSPLVTWSSAPPASIASEQVSFSVLLSDQGDGIGNVRVLLDGVPVDQASNRGLSRYVSQNKRTFQLIIPEGSHTITVDAMPAENIGIPNTLTKTVTSTYKKTSKPKLHAVVVGVNDYQNPKLNLSYAKKDADAIFASLSKQVGGLYDKGTMTLLNTSANTSKASIIETIKKTKSNVTMNDVFVFYVAGHGYNFPDIGYHLFTSDVSGTSARKIKHTGIDAEALQDLLASVKTNKKLILLDTCDSGGSIDASKLLSRGMDEQTVIDRLNRKSGATVLMASSDKQKALEGYKNHGLFTYALLQAFQGNADNNQDGYLKTTELSNYIDDELPMLAKQAFNFVQEPYVSSAGRGFEFKVVKPKTAVKHPHKN